MFHLSGYLTFPLIILLLITWLPIILHPDWVKGIPMTFMRTFMSIAMLGVPIQYTLGQIVLHRADIRRIVNLPWFMIIGTGMTLSNSLAIFEGLCGKPSAFMRTPKFRMEGGSETWKRSAYVMSADPTAFGEVMMVGYAAFMTLESWRSGNLSAIPFLLLYVLGFATWRSASLPTTGPSGDAQQCALKRMRNSPSAQRRKTETRFLKEPGFFTHAKGPFAWVSH